MAFVKIEVHLPFSFPLVEVVYFNLYFLLKLTVDIVDSIEFDGRGWDRCPENNHPHLGVDVVALGTVIFVGEEGQAKDETLLFFFFFFGGGGYVQGGSWKFRRYFICHVMSQLSSDSHKKLHISSK